MLENGHTIAVVVSLLIHDLSKFSDAIVVEFAKLLNLDNVLYNYVAFTVYGLSIMPLTRLFWCFLLVALFSGCTGVPESRVLKPFSSDGCSSFPNGTGEDKNLWLNCCVEHDYDYWKGGTYEQRLASDKRLKMCVSQSGKPEIAYLMLAGVRVGGSPFWPTSFRWGYGWDYPSFYGELTDQQRQQVQDKSPQSFNNLIKAKQ